MLIVSRTRCIAQCALLLGVCVLAGCAEKTDVPVNLHGINYGGETFSYYVKDPGKPESSEAGGELIDAFSAGGTTCCFTLPKKWRPGIKVQVRTTHWLAARPDGSLPEVKQVQLVDVPPYATGLPGELWVLRASDSSVSVISSDFQPDHPNWPGKVKGWPVPSVEYRRERWELHRKDRASAVTLHLELLAELDESPTVHTLEAWQYAKGRHDDQHELKDFSGPDDARYASYLRERYTKGLELSRSRLKEIEEMRP